jgi:glutamyl-Q tRNA(Asp) synthetase
MYSAFARVPRQISGKIPGPCDPPESPPASGPVIRTRFAPSPTGRLHLGHVLAALVAWDMARQAGPQGRFLLRHEDIDSTRVREPWYAGIEEDLLWLGLPWDGPPLRQTTRAQAYAEALQRLIRLGVVYPCFCTRKEIRAEWKRMAGAPQDGRELPYPGTCRDHPDHQRRQWLETGLPHAWRLNARAAAEITGHLVFTDLRHGILPVDPDLCGDVVLARKDIGPAYHLAVTVDDAFQQITHVTRGEDLLDATHVHRQLQALLGLPEPQYLHHRLVTDASGQRLAKRSDALSIATMRAAGCQPQDVMRRVEKWLE